MKNIVILCCIFLINITTNQTKSQTKEQNKLSIAYPKNNQKVRGIYKIYGKAKPNSTLKLTINSTYYKTNNNNQTKLTKGEGSIKRLNRTYSLTANRSGIWTIENIELVNAGWEEYFYIKVSDGKETNTIIVYDKTRPVLID